MIEVKFKLNGRDVRVGDLGRELSRSIETEMRRNAEQRIGRVKSRRCPEHGKTPTVRTTRDGFSVEACCERFTAEIQREITR